MVRRFIYWTIYHPLRHPLNTIRERVLRRPIVITPGMVGIQSLWTTRPHKQYSAWERLRLRVLNRIYDFDDWVERLLLGDGAA